MLDVLPIAGVLAVFQLGVLRQAIPNLKKVLIGSLYVVLGLAFFLVGLEKALFPLGKDMAKYLIDYAFTAEAGKAADMSWTDFYAIYLFAGAIGFSTTIAEPSLIAVAINAREASGNAISAWGLRIAVALG